jgi:glutamine synthetase
MTPDEIEHWLDANDITWVRTEGLTVDGMVIGKHLHRSTFLAALPGGNNISEIAFGLDLGGTPYLTWWPDWRRDALGDLVQRPDPSTLRVVDNRPGVASVFVDHTELDGTPLPICPRALLRTMIQRVESCGYSIRAAFELEGMLFREPMLAARARGFSNLTPMAVAAPVGYSIANSSEQAPFFDAVLPRLERLGIEIEGWHDEAAPGQFELNFVATDALGAADAIVRSKQVMRETAAELGCSVTFMAKPSTEYGNGLHVHHSLLDIDSGRPVLFAGPGELSALGRRWLAGIVASTPAATSILAPTINSYRRIVAWAAAPTTATWAEDNKTTAVRILTRSATSTRIEHRLAAGDAQPHLVLAAILAGGLVGLTDDVALPAPLAVSGWGLPESGWPHLPTSIMTAADVLRDDGRFTASLGEDFVSHWIETRKWEWLMFNTDGGDASAGSVTDWERRRYFELI